MNCAFLAKQFWRILTNPSSILSRTLKARYFQNCSILSSTLRSNASPAWKEIWKSGMSIKNGLITTMIKLLFGLGIRLKFFLLSLYILTLDLIRKGLSLSNGVNARIRIKLLHSGNPYGALRSKVKSSFSDGDYTIIIACFNQPEKEGL